MARHGGKRGTRPSGKNEDNPNQPVDPPVPRVIPIDPRKFPIPGQPFNPAQLEQTIEEICRFIEDARKRHLKRYKVDVGERLFMLV